jgi:multidrug resistance efflux pump
VYPSPFARSVRALRDDSSRRALWVIGLAVASILVWTTWFLLAPVAVYAVSSSARVLLDRSAHPIEAPFDGRLESIACDLGDEVREGDILLTLDTEVLQMRVAEERAREHSLETQRDALAAQVLALTEARSEAQAATLIAVREAKSVMASLALSAELADEEYDRLRRLREHGGTSDFEISRARIQAAKMRLEIETYRTALERIQFDRRVLDNDRTAAIENLRRDSLRSSGELIEIGAAIARMEHGIREHTIRAPTDGVVGHLTDLGRGSIVSRGVHLGTVVSPGDLIVVADFEPEAALGRIHPGQPARVRLDGFPWSEYGTLSVSVVNVALEIRDGLVRVEFRILEPESSRIPLQHALPGVVEVTVDTVTPVRLTLRHAARLLSVQSDEAVPEASP